jgi:hypothetical protein
MYLRIPEDVRERVRREADANGRSLTGEIVYRLRQAYGLKKTTSGNKD